MVHAPGLGVVAFAAATAGTMVTRAAVLAQDAVIPTEPTGWVNTSIAGASVLALIYIARLFAAGKLVARDPDQVEDKLISLAERLADLTEQVVKVLERSERREDRYIDLLRHEIGERNGDVAT